MTHSPLPHAESGHPHQMPAGARELAIHDPLADSFPPGFEGRLLWIIAIAFSVFQIATAAHFVDFPSQVVRAVHVGFLMMLVFPLVAAARNAGPAVKAAAWALALIGLGVALYQWANYTELLLRAGDINRTDLIVGILALATVFLAAWAEMGIALPLIAGAFLLYCLFGQYAPGMFQTRGYDLAQVLEQMAYGTEGIYGIPIYVSSSYIFLFILFGAFLEKAGMIKLFTDVSLGLVGHLLGGPAKVAVISSALMGTISGSGVANVVTTGQFTIPLMKRFGYRPAFAGGVEATASMGGQLMPPVMGAVAFIMAETLGVEYVQIVKAAIIPAILYFGAAFWMVHLEAGKRGLVGMSKDALPSPRRALVQGWYLLLPLAVLVWLLFSGTTPLYAGTIGLALTIVLILGASIALGMPAGIIRAIIWVGLGLACAWIFSNDLRLAMPLVGALVGLLVLGNLVTRGGRETLWICINSLADGAKTALPVGVACALVGIIMGTVSLTGVATTLGSMIVSLGQGSLFLSLILTMVTCIVLGMGIPTIPNYIITSTIAAAALGQLGVPLIVSHMFVFYFGILADLTPPVALACFAAAPFAKESGLKISFEAIKIAAAGFVVPFMAVYVPALMLQDGGPLATAIGYAPAVVYITIKAVLAMGLWGMAVIGWMHRLLAPWERVLAMIASFTLIYAAPWSDAVGFALTAVAIAWLWVSRGRVVAA